MLEFGAMWKDEKIMTGGSVKTGEGGNTGKTMAKKYQNWLSQFTIYSLQFTVNIHIQQSQKIKNKIIQYTTLQYSRVRCRLEVFLQIHKWAKKNIIILIRKHNKNVAAKWNCINNAVIPAHPLFLSLSPLSVKCC